MEIAECLHIFCFIDIDYCLDSHVSHNSSRLNILCSLQLGASDRRIKNIWEEGGQVGLKALDLVLIS